MYDFPMVMRSQDKRYLVDQSACAHSHGTYNGIVDCILKRGNLEYWHAVTCIILVSVDVCLHNSGVMSAGRISIGVI